MKLLKIIFFIGSCLIISFLSAQSFVKEKVKKTKKISLSRCQEQSITPLARLMQESNKLAQQAHELLDTGIKLTEIGNEFLSLAVMKQDVALKATGDLLDEEANGGQFATMTMQELEDYCLHLNQISSALQVSREALEDQKNDLAKLVSTMQVEQLSLTKKCT